MIIEWFGMSEHISFLLLMCIKYNYRFVKIEAHLGYYYILHVSLHFSIVDQFLTFFILFKIYYIFYK